MFFQFDISAGNFVETSGHLVPCFFNCSVDCCCSLSNRDATVFFYQQSKIFKWIKELWKGHDKTDKWYDFSWVSILLLFFNVGLVIFNWYEKFTRNVTENEYISNGNLFFLIKMKKGLAWKISDGVGYIWLYAARARSGRLLSVLQILLSKQWNMLHFISWSGCWWLTIYKTQEFEWSIVYTLYGNNALWLCLSSKERLGTSFSLSLLSHRLSPPDMFFQIFQNWSFEYVAF